MSYGAPALYQDKTPGPNQVRLPFSFQCNGAAQPTLISGKGVVSVVRTAVGSFTVTLASSYQSLICGTVTITNAPGGYLAFCSGVNVANPTTPTVQVGTYQIGSGNLDTSGGSRVNVDLVLSTDQLNQ